MVFQLKEISNVSSLLPGLLVQALITSVSQFGLNVEMLGSFSGTIDLYQIPQGDTSRFVSGKKVKARVLYEIVGSSPPQFALSLCEHVVSLKPKTLTDGKETLEDGFPIGTQLQSIKVIRVESERGLVVEVRDMVYGFVHVRLILLSGVQDFNRKYRSLMSPTSMFPLCLRTPANGRSAASIQPVLSVTILSTAFFSCPCGIPF